METLGHYKILKKLGSGGMGEVYLAQDQVLGRRVAVKTIRSGASQDSVASARFLREARSIAALNHPNIAVIYEVGWSDDGPFLVMEYIDGRNLREVLSAGRLPEETVLRYALAMASALEHAHGNGIIHRDIKPANIVITAGDHLKLLDFGLAKVLQGETNEDETLSQLTQAGMIVGTPQYLPPEILTGAQSGIRGDIYSLGVVLYEMSCGQPPYSGLTGHALTTAILRGAAPPLASRHPGVSRTLQNIIARCMALSPDDRFLTAGDLAHALRPQESSRSSISPQAVSVTPLVGVLDFQNVSGDPSVDWLGTGLAETLTADLNKLKQVRVVSRERIQGAFRRGADSSHLAEIGRRLGARWLIHGSFQRAGNRLRITPQVLDISTDEVVASTKVDGNFDDIFELQDRVVRDLMAVLEVDLNTSTLRNIALPETRLLDAYEAYALGRKKAYELSKESLELARQYFERAVALDPNYAVAFSALGGVYAMRFIHRTDPEDLANAVTHLERALELDKELGEPYPWLCYIYARQGKLELAETMGRRGTQLQGDIVRSYYLLGVTYLIIAETDSHAVPKAISCFEKAIAIDTRWEPAWMFLGWIAATAGAYEAGNFYLDNARELLQTRRASGWVPGAETAWSTLLLKQKRYEEAEQAYQFALGFLQTTDHIFREPIMALAACGLGDVQLRRSRPADALGAYRRALHLTKEFPRMLGVQRVRLRAQLGMAAAAAAEGSHGYAVELMREVPAALVESSEQPHTWMWEASIAQLFYAAAVAALRCLDPDRALDHLEAAVKHGWCDPFWPAADPELSSLHHTPRFVEWLKSVRSLPPPQMPQIQKSSQSMAAFPLQR